MVRLKGRVTVIEKDRGKINIHMTFKTHRKRVTTIETINRFRRSFVVFLRILNTIRLRIPK